MQGDAVLQRFATVNRHIHLALDALPYQTFDMPEEVLEQVPTQNSSTILKIDQLNPSPAIPLH